LEQEEQWTTERDSPLDAHPGEKQALGHGYSVGETTTFEILNALCSNSPSEIEKILRPLKTFSFLIEQKLYIYYEKSLHSTKVIFASIDLNVQKYLM
jgi:hypothetical protein